MEPSAEEAAELRATIAAYQVEIRQREQVEAQLRESEQRFRLMADTAPVMIWISDPDKLCSYFNRGWLEFTGRTLAQELGNGWADGVHPDDLPGCFATYSDAFDARRDFRMEYRLRRYDGHYGWVLDSGTPRFASDGEFLGYIGTAIDITEQKMAEVALRGSREQFRELSAHMLSVQEEERARIAREVHDELGQTLTALKLDLAWLNRSADRGRPAAERRERVEQMIEQVDEAGATEARVRLALQPEQLLLEVRDNGRGIPAQAIADRRSLGLIGMRERVRPWRGQVALDGDPGRGTGILVTLPQAPPTLREHP